MTGSLAHGVFLHSASPRLFFWPLLPPLTIVSAALSTSSVSGFQYFFFGYYFRLWFFELTFHLILPVVRATIRVVVLVFCSNVPTIGLDRLVFVRGRQTCCVSDLCFFGQFGISSHRFLSYNRPRNCRFSPSAVFRLCLPRFS